jgi:hypothetical protein
MTGGVAVAGLSIDTVIVGSGYKGWQAIRAVKMMAPGDQVRLVRERDNRHDANAVACHYLGMHVGYVPRQANPRVAAAIDAGAEAIAIVTHAAGVHEFAGKTKITVEPKIKISWGA